MRKRAEKRRDRRFAVRLPVDIRYEGLDCTGFTADVSVRGAFVRAGVEADPLLSVLQPGDWVTLSVALSGDEPIDIPARVVHSRDRGAGFEFMNLEPRLAMAGSA